MFKNASSSVSLIGVPYSILKLKASILSFYRGLSTILLRVPPRTYILSQ
jgi:hypothetical protein